MILRTGKADENVLDRSVRKRLGSALVPRMGTASDPVTLRTGHPGMLAVTAAANDLAAQGIRPESVRTELLFPIGTEESVLRSAEDEIRRTAQLAGMTIAGGHTETTSAVTRPIVVAHTECREPLFACAAKASGMAGFIRGEEGKGAADPSYLWEGRRSPRPGDLILALGPVGLEGTFLLTEAFAQELGEHFPERFLKKAEQTGEHLLVLPLLVALSKRGLDPLHLVNVSEGGILAALWRLGCETGLGLEVSMPDIPILQETIEIAEYWGINPYQMESAGCVLAVIDAEQESLWEHGGAPAFPARVIGALTGGRDKILLSGQERQHINRPAADALLPLLG